MTEKIIIIGSGTAGLSAAFYAARLDLEPLVLEGEPPLQPGGQLRASPGVENYPGLNQKISGNELMDQMRDQAESFGAVIKTETVVKVNFSKTPFEVVTKSKAYTAHSVIVATGGKNKVLHLSAEKKFMNQGISTCGVCDGGLPCYRNKILAVIGGGDAACEEALFLTKFAEKVLLVFRKDKLKASAVLIKKVEQHEKIELHANCELIDIEGHDTPELICVRNNVSKALMKLKAAGVFYAIGHEPNTDVLNSALELDSKGYINTNDGTKTSKDGVFACGEVQDAKYKQIATSIGSGCMAAMDAFSWLSGKGL